MMRPLPARARHARPTRVFGLRFEQQQVRRIAAAISKTNATVPSSSSSTTDWTSVFSVKLSTQLPAAHICAVKLIEMHHHAAHFRLRLRC